MLPLFKIEKEKLCIQIIEEVRDTDEESDVKLKIGNRYGSGRTGNSEKVLCIYT